MNTSVQTKKSVETSVASEFALKGKREHDFYNNAYGYLNFTIGGLENILMDYDENTEEYKNAQEELDNEKGLIESAFAETTKGLYADGCEMCDNLSIMRARAFYMVSRKRRFQIIRHALKNIKAGL